MEDKRIQELMGCCKIDEESSMEQQPLFICLFYMKCDMINAVHRKTGGFLMENPLRKWGWWYLTKNTMSLRHMYMEENAANTGEEGS
ncbi:MAG: hypothetical protein LBT06_01105 [Hungatella sp.]|jgi:hypothetical protein|nr:hypothetical protein [Hungatella sp.]